MQKPLINAQNRFGSEVVDYHFGKSQTTGQTPPYFPSNILNGIGYVQSLNVPVSLPEDICSLGKNGWIILKFDPPIINKLGLDFIVFENAFIYGANFVYDEWIKVSASKDGKNYKTFPFDSITGVGFAGRTPTAPFGSNYANPNESGGDAFDLETIGLDTAYFIKLEDATRYQTPDRLGAEVDAVYAIHQAQTNALKQFDKINELLSVNCNSIQSIFCDSYLISFKNKMFITKIEILNLLGQVINNYEYSSGKSAIEITKQNLTTGAFILQVYHNELTYRTKINFN